MKAPYQKYYYAVVYKGTDKLLLLNAQLPIFWRKSEAQFKADTWNAELEVKRISHEQMLDFLM